MIVTQTAAVDELLYIFILQIMMGSDVFTHVYIRLSLKLPVSWMTESTETFDSNVGLDTKVTSVL